MTVFLKHRRRPFIILLTLAFLIVSDGVIGQVRWHDSGDLGLQIFGGGYFSYEWNIPTRSLRFPNGWSYRDNMLLYSVFMMTDYDIILNDQGDIGQNGIWPGHSQENNNKPQSIRKVYRYQPPSVTVDGVLLTPYFDDELDPNLPCDQMIEIHYVMCGEVGPGYPGVDIVQRSYSYVNENHDQYIIFDVNYIYSQRNGYDPTQYMPDNPLDAWLGIHYGLQPGYVGPRRLGFTSWSQQDDVPTYIETPSQYSSTRDNLIISYCYDSDNPIYQGDDTGDPDPDTGEFLSFHYPGWALLHADTDVDDETDDPDQPFTLGYDSYNTLWNDDNEWAITRFNTGTFEDNEDILSVKPCLWQMTKEYHFEKDDDLHLVYAVGVGAGMTIEEAKEHGAIWKAGGMTDGEKNDLLEGGLDDLITHMDRAAWTWERDLQVPAPPPSPNIVVTSGPDEIKVEWSDVSTVPDPVTGVVDFTGYRVYRSIGSRDTTYTLLYDGQDNVHIDQDVTRGIAYHYYVTAYDDGTQNTDGLVPGQSMESSHYLNRTGKPAYAFKIGADDTGDVLVVPNPYDRTGQAVNYPGEPNKILFVNLPPVCTIRIYTVSGKLIKVIEHQSGSGDEAWDLITAYNQYVASGVYLFRVDDATTWAGDPLDSQHGKFIVIR